MKNLEREMNVDTSDISDLADRYCSAKEIARELVVVFMNGTNDVETLKKIKPMGERLEKRIIEYAAKKCKEQRSIIHTYQLFKHRVITADVKDSIYNSPEPKFD